MNRAEFGKATTDISFKDRGYELRVAVTAGATRKAAIVRIKNPYLPTIDELRTTLDWLEVGCIDKVVS
jgi:hypothetical protein